MENQGNMQSGKKAAVIYFLAAFFIACIGIAGANYLKGELGLSAEELVKKVELTVEIAVLLGIAIAVRHLLKKRNRKIAGIIVFLFVAGVFSWQNSGIWQESQLKPQRLETPESEFDRYDIKDGHFTVAEANANIVKEINVDYLDNVTVHFSKPVTQKVIVRVLYETKTQHGFDNKTRKMRVKVHKGETVGCVSMKVKDVTRIKIGIGRKIGTQFDYGYTEINGNYAARMHQKKVSMAKYFVLFMLIPAGYFILAAGKKWQEKTDKNICLRILSFPFGFITILSLFATFLVVNLVEWVKMTCGNVSFSIILLQLTSPIKGTDSGIINSIIKTAVVPPVLLAVAAVLCYLFIVRGMYALEDLPVKKIPRWSKICIEVVMVVFFLHTVQVQGTEIGMWDYIQSVRESSDFYEKEYVNPAKVKMTFPKEKKNLIYIFMESMESSYADKEDGGTMDDNYIPNLTKLARENVQFTDKKDGKVGGPVCLEATAYTAGGLVAQTSAINLKVMNSGAVSDSFLPNLTALGDILNKQGYNQMFLCGSDGDFAGRDAYFKTHKDYQIEDYKAAIKEGDIPKDYKVYWGHEDKVLYERAKKNLKKLSKEGKPFNLTMLTVDTHFPNGYICDLCENKYDTTYGNAVACADRQVYDFVQFSNLKKGVYEVSETLPASDYEFKSAEIAGETNCASNKETDKNTLTFAIGYEDLNTPGSRNVTKNLGKALYTNERLSSITMKKIGEKDSENKDTPLKGAKFKIERITETDGKESYESAKADGSDYIIETAEDGTAVFEGLKEGKYRITEVQSPKGYSLLANPIEVTLPYVTSGNAGVETNGKPVKVGDTDYYYYDLTYTVKNNKLFDMPEAGGGFRATLFGIAIMIIAGGWYIIRRRRKIV